MENKARYIWISAFCLGLTAGYFIKDIVWDKYDSIMGEVRVSNCLYQISNSYAVLDCLASNTTDTAIYVLEKHMLTSMDTLASLSEELNRPEILTNESAVVASKYLDKHNVANKRLEDIGSNAPNPQP